MNLNEYDVNSHLEITLRLGTIRVDVSFNPNQLVVPAFHVCNAL